MENSINEIISVQKDIYLQCCDPEQRLKEAQLYIELMNARNAMLEAEHDYNNPIREQRERRSEYRKALINGGIQAATYLAVAFAATKLEFTGHIVPNSLKDVLKKTKA